jgi:cytochrome P450
MTREAPTAPGDLPLLGHSLSLLRPDRVGYLTSLQPLGDVVKIKIGTLPYLVLNSPDLVRTVQVEEAKSFDRGRIFMKARPYVGDGLFTAIGAEHNRQRRMVQPAFHRAQIGHYIQVISESARAQVAGWTPGATVDIEREMHVLASEMVCRAMFRAPEARDVVQVARDQLPDLVQGLGVRTVLPDLFTRLPIPVNRRFDAACDNLRDAAARLVSVYRERHGEPGQPEDFVSMLMDAHDPRTDSGLSDTNIRDQIMTLLISGIETPATTLTWALYELARNPDVRQRLESEVDEVLGGRDIEPTDLHSLRYTSAFVQEMLRLHHPLWLLMRRAVKPVTIGGVRLQPDDEVIYSPAAMHRDPTYFPDPMRVRPERWLEDSPDLAKMQKAFIGFGFGNRQCIGDNFAMAQMTIAIATIAAHCRLTPAAGHRPKTVVTSVVHLDRLPMVVGARKKAVHS